MLVVRAYGACGALFAGRGETNSKPGWISFERHNGLTMGSGERKFSMMTTKEYIYSWHLSLRVDRPVEDCNLRPHAYMYGKKLDDREADKPLPPHSKKMREPPPNHEFSYRWFRGPTHEPCAYEGCPVLMIGPCMHSGDLVVRCNAYQPSQVCTNAHFAIRNVSSMHGKRNILFQRK